MNDRKGLSKRSPPFFEAKWGSGGRWFKSTHPDSDYCADEDRYKGCS